MALAWRIRVGKLAVVYLAGALPVIITDSAAPYLDRPRGLTHGVQAETWF